MAERLKKVQILGTSEIYREKVFVMQLLHGRSSDRVRRPFFAEYDEKTMWFDDLKPAFGENKFFFEKNADDKKFSCEDSQKKLRKESFIFS